MPDYAVHPERYTCYEIEPALIIGSGGEGDSQREVKQVPSKTPNGWKFAQHRWTLHSFNMEQSLGWKLFLVSSTMSFYTMCCIS